MKQVLISIVSDHILASLLPALKMRAEYHLLLCTDSMEPKAERLKNLIANALEGCAEDIFILKGFPENDFQLIKEYVAYLEKYAREKWPDTRMILNITGGNKLMSIGAYQASMELVDQVIYTDTHHNQLQVIHSRDGNNDPIPLGSLLDVETYLAANGKVLTESENSTYDRWQERIESRQDLTCWLGDNIRHLVKEEGSSFFRNINAAAARALENKDRFVEQQELHYEFKGYWHDALERLSDAGVIHWHTSSPKTIIFPDRERARYVNGGWLEEYLWIQANHIGIGDVIANAEFRNDDDDWRDTVNEMDLLLCHNNRLLMVECKTAVFNKDHKDADVLNKLSNIGREAGGIFCDKLLVSVHTLDQSRNHSVTARAQSKGIQYLEWDDVSHADSWLRRWLDGHC